MVGQDGKEVRLRTPAQIHFSQKRQGAMRFSCRLLWLEKPLFCR